MASRASIPLIVCLVAAAIAGFGLLRSADGITNDAAPAAAEAQPEVPSEPAVPSVATISISNFSFEADVVVPAGATVQVANGVGAPHTLTSTDGSFDTGTIAGGATGTFVAPSEPGTYSFFCEIHPSMTGSFTVDS